MRKTCWKLRLGAAALGTAASAVLACLPGAAFGQAATVITFENLPDQVPVTEQYASLGVHFSGATTLHQFRSLNPVFPPHSGTGVVYDFPTGIITARFDRTQQVVGGYVTGNRSIALRAFDASGNLLGSAQTGGPNYVGSPSGIPPNVLLQVSSTAGSIAAVTFHDSGNTFTVDDFFFIGPAPAGAGTGRPGSGRSTNVSTAQQPWRIGGGSAVFGTTGTSPGDVDGLIISFSAFNNTSQPTFGFTPVSVVPTDPRTATLLRGGMQKPPLYTTQLQGVPAGEGFSVDWEFPVTGNEGGLYPRTFPPTGTPLPLRVTVGSFSQDIVIAWP